VKFRLARAAAFALLACACGSDDEEASPAFNRWCGEILCDWMLEQGRIERAPTWHEKDYGARMLDAPVVISHPTTLNDQTCTRFSLVGDVEAEAQLVLELDVYDNGPIEFEETIPETRWEKQTFVVPPVDLNFAAQAIVSASLRLHKRGAGNVVLARLEVGTIPCVATTLITLRDIPDGEFCPSADRCRSGRCEPSPSVPGVGVCVAP